MRQRGGHDQRRPRSHGRRRARRRRGTERLRDPRRAREQRRRDVHRPVPRIPVSRWKTALNLNLLAPVTLIQGFLPGMLERDEGRIINITSSAARTREVPATNVPQLAYAASKAALDSFSFGLVNDLAGTGVALNLLRRSCSPNRSSTTSPPPFDEVKRRMAHMGPYGEAVAMVADQPLDFHGRYLENHDLEALGFLSRAWFNNARQRRPRDPPAMAIERFPMEAGHVLMFARAIGDPNPVYADTERGAGVRGRRHPAPPTFVTASAQFDPDYPLRPKAGRAVVRLGQERDRRTPRPCRRVAPAAAARAARRAALRVPPTARGRRRAPRPRPHRASSGRSRAARARWSSPS